MSSFGGALQLVGLGLLAQALFCPHDKNHKVENPDWAYCPYCGTKLVREKLTHE